MKRREVFACGLVAFLAVGILAPAGAAQTKAPAKKSAEAQAPAAASASFDLALLRPAALQEKAPEVFDVKFTTAKGDFVIRVTHTWAPLGADRFYNLVKHGFYDGASFFRVVPSFVVQFGISGHPEVSRVWQSATIKDDPVKQSNKRGMVTFATAGPNTRTTQVFINLSDRNAALDAQGFAPFGQVVQGMEVVEKLYSGYGEGLTDKQGLIQSRGSAYLEKEFPKLDKIISATIIISPNEPQAPPKKASQGK